MNKALGWSVMLSGGLVWLWTPAAEAQGLDSCQNIHLEAQAQCELVPPGVQCETECTPLTVEAACAARLEVDCSGHCNASASVMCSASCEADCSAQCAVDPGKFECSGACRADCGASCSGHCAASADKASCAASCEASCGASCDVSCDVEAPTVDCNAKCDASCSGSCDAQANLDCQIDCQADGFAECRVDVQGGCKTACQTQRGALFCDGQYVDYGNNFEECVAALRTLLDAEIDGYAEGESRCEEGQCSARGEAGVNCQISPAAPASGAAYAWLLVGVPALLSRLIRRRRKS
jgi:hypothetical protein